MRSQPERVSQAVALVYDPDDGAPRVLAKGRGLLAEEIIARAQSAGVFVHESPELVSLLMQVDMDARIPPELYIAVAELLAWLYQLEQQVDGAPGSEKAPEPPVGGKSIPGRPGE